MMVLPFQPIHLQTKKALHVIHPYGQIYRDISTEEISIIENTPTESGQYENRSQLLEKEYINNITDDLLEVLYIPNVYF